MMLLMMIKMLMMMKVDFVLLVFGNIDLIKSITIDIVNIIRQQHIKSPYTQDLQLINSSVNQKYK